MSESDKKKIFVIKQGETFTQVLRWEDENALVYKAITAITKSAPVRITAAGHGLLDGQRVLIESVKGMIELNRVPRTSIRDSDYRIVNYVDSATIELVGVNTSAVDENGDDLYTAYTSGGYLRYYAPASLASQTVRMTIKDKIGGTVLASTEVAHAPLNIITAVLDDTAKTIALSITATNTAAITWTRGVYDVEAVGAVSGAVTRLRAGTISISKEVTT